MLAFPRKPHPHRRILKPRLTAFLARLQLQVVQQAAAQQARAPPPPPPQASLSGSA